MEELFDDVIKLVTVFITVTITLLFCLSVLLVTIVIFSDATLKEAFQSTPTTVMAVMAVIIGFITGLVMLD